MLDEILSKSPGDGIPPLDAVIAELHNSDNVVYEDVIRWESRLTDPVERLNFYFHVIDSCFGTGSTKTIQHGVHGYIKGQRMKAMGEVNNLIRKDPLTGLPNKLAYAEGIEGILNRAKRFYKEGCMKAALIYIDVNRFKEVNDNHGHQFGDEVLKYVAEGVNGCTRSTDLKARIGGDEFVVALDAIEYSVENAQKILRQVTLRIEDVLQHNLRYKHPKKKIDISISAGMSIFGIDANDLEELSSHADEAMYFAKKNPVSEETQLKRASDPNHLYFHVWRQGIAYTPKDARIGRD